jgi:Na+/citrate or Na+/malate symporter
VIGGVLNRVGQRYPHLTGNGQLVRNQENAVSAESVSADSTVKIGTDEYAAGLGVALFLFVFSGFWALHISLINHAGWKFTISQFAYMVIFTGILNISGILPAEVRAGAKGIQRFFIRYFTPALMVLIGLGTTSTRSSVPSPRPTSSSCCSRSSALWSAPH